MAMSQILPYSPPVFPGPKRSPQPKASLDGGDTMGAKSFPIKSPVVGIPEPIVTNPALKKLFVVGVPEPIVPNPSPRKPIATAALVADDPIVPICTGGTCSRATKATIDILS